MLHSILIPHRDRNQHLGLCLWSLDRSACACGVTDWEVVIVDCGSRRLPEGTGPHMRVIVDRDAPESFNKSRALNLAMDQARGDVLTFLDADAIVGERFLEAAGCLADASLDRCCYRVRYLPMEESVRVETAEDRAAYVSELFEDYTRYELAQESYRRHDLDRRRVHNVAGQPWGNSQFSMLRGRLNGHRFDEEIGYPLEDWDMAMRLEVEFGQGYRGRIFTDPEHAMFHLRHAAPSWVTRGWLSQRRALYRQKRHSLGYR